MNSINKNKDNSFRSFRFDTLTNELKSKAEEINIAFRLADLYMECVNNDRNINEALVMGEKEFPEYFKNGELEPKMKKLRMNAIGIKMTGGTEELAARGEISQAVSRVLMGGS